MTTTNIVPACDENKPIPDRLAGARFDSSLVYPWFGDWPEPARMISYSPLYEAEFEYQRGGKTLRGAYSYVAARMMPDSQPALMATWRCPQQPPHVSRVLNAMDRRINAEFAMNAAGGKGGTAFAWLCAEADVQDAQRHWACAEYERRKANPWSATIANTTPV